MTQDRPPDAVGHVISMIYAQFAESITVAEMARSVRYSRFHFSREFQRATGVTPGRFLATVRMQEAKRLLLTTSLSVGEVAVRVGYSSVGTFSAKFKATVGFSPTTYRTVAYAQQIPDPRDDTPADGGAGSRTATAAESSTTPGVSDATSDRTSDVATDAGPGREAPPTRS